MILVDVYNVMYTGESSRPYDYATGNISLRCIPFILHRIAAAHSIDKDVVLVFDSNTNGTNLTRTDGYKAGRKFSPLVKWELRILEYLLAYFKIPYVFVPGQEADTIINSICAEKRGKEDIYIMSADADMWSNIYDDGTHKCSTLSFSSRSYSVNKETFEDISRDFPYNFTDIYKMLLGCKSDNIRPLEGGRKLYNDYLDYVYTSMKYAVNFDRSTKRLSDLPDRLLLPLTRPESLLNWMDKKGYLSAELERVLKERQVLVQGQKIEPPSYTPINWQRFNDMVVHLLLEKIALVRQESSVSFSIDNHVKILTELSNIERQNVAMFEDNSSPSGAIASTFLDLTELIGDGDM